MRSYKGDYKTLLAWQKARELVKAIYEVTKAFPKEELYGLTSQIRRAAVSVPANIAEGHARPSAKEYAQFVGIAYASATELETLIFLSSDIGYLDAKTGQTFIDQIQEILKMTGTLRLAILKEAQG